MAVWPFWLKERGTERISNLEATQKPGIRHLTQCMPFRLCLPLLLILVPCANTTKNCASSPALLEAYTTPSGAECAGQLQRRSMQFFVLFNLPVVILSTATATSSSLTRTCATTSAMEKFFFGAGRAGPLPKWGGPRGRAAPNRIGRV